MAGWRKTLLGDWDEGSINDADTSKVVKLPQALISAIHLRLSGTGGSGTPAVDDLLATMKVKSKKGYVTDLRSADARKIARAKNGTAPQVTNASGAYTATNHSLYFGRFRRDKAFMLDLRNDNVRQLELSFGTLIATTAWATTTVVLTVTIDEWLGAPPKEYKSAFVSEKEVENKATGTAKAIFDLFAGDKLLGVLITIGTITTIRQCVLGDRGEKVQFGKANFRDLIAEHNTECNPDTVETVVALWTLADLSDDFVNDLPVLNMSDPVCSIERGATTSTSRVVQLSVLNN